MAKKTPMIDLPPEPAPLLERFESGEGRTITDITRLESAQGPWGTFYIMDADDAETGENLEWMVPKGLFRPLREAIENHGASEVALILRITRTGVDRDTTWDVVGV